MATQLTGWRKDKRDERDLLHIPRLVVPKIPTSVNLGAFLPDVRDQGSIGSCVGFGIGGTLGTTAAMRQAFVEWFSPTWIYNGAREIEGSLNEDSGAYPRDAYDFLLKRGCLLERYWPYSGMTLDTTAPSHALDDEADAWPLAAYYRVTDGVDGICSALADGHVVSIGNPWFDSWVNVGFDGILTEDYSGVAGGHETFLYGYDKALGVFFGQNSWGNGWGRNGRYLMPFSAIEKFKLHGGYDAHYIDVTWAAGPDPDAPKGAGFPWAFAIVSAVTLGGMLWAIKACR